MFRYSLGCAIDISSANIGFRAIKSVEGDQSFQMTAYRIIRKKHPVIRVAATGRHTLQNVIATACPLGYTLLDPLKLSRISWPPLDELPKPPVKTTVPNSGSTCCTFPFHGHFLLLSCPALYSQLGS